MDMKEAVKVAKDYIQQLLVDEKISDLGLEEIEQNPRSGTWNITLGFSRPWDSRNNIALLGGAAPRRTYWTLQVRESDGEVLSVRIRETAN